jgi:DNA-binding response OmpR family regulator
MALEAAGVTNPLRTLSDGKEALDYFNGTGRYADRKKYPIPYLVLMDLKLPHVMGLDVLKSLRQRSDLAALVVLVLSSWANPTDIDAAYRLGANGYLVKPSSFEKLQVLARALLKDFWLVHNQPSPLAFGYQKRNLPPGRALRVGFHPMLTASA